MKSLVIVLLAILVGFTTVFFAYSRQAAQVIKPTEKQKKQALPTLSAEEETLAKQKKQILAEIEDGQVYFATLKTSLKENLYQIDVYLSAKPEMKVDAADLIIRTDKNLTIEEVKKGQVFADYPRLINEKQTATITGIAKLGQDKIVFGEPNQIFASLLVSKNKTNLPAKLTVDTENTKAFLNGQMVLDKQVSFNEITL